MKNRSAIPGLISEIQKNREVLTRMDSFFKEFETRHSTWPEIDTEAAMSAAQFFSNFYTCTETIYFRISSFFENNLSKERWHSHLLERMSCAVNDERPQVISDATASVLSEFLKFRLFTRYYFEFNYDRDKLAFLAKKYHQCVPMLQQDLNTFTAFIQSLLQ